MKISQRPATVVEFEGRFIGPGYPTFIIAEAGLNHNGSLAAAKRLVDVAVEAGADCVKFQKRDVVNLAVKDVLDARDERFPALGRTYREIRERLEFGEAEYTELAGYCRSRGIAFLCTAFDVASVDFLQTLGVGAFKLASHSLTNTPLIEKVAALRKPIFLSTGMCTLEEIKRSVEIIQEQRAPVVIFHCVSAYPHKEEESNIRLIDVLLQRHGVPVGYSGHEIGYFPTLVAVARGAVAVERHFTLDRNQQGFDHSISLEPAELLEMVREIRRVEGTLGRGAKEVSETEWVTRRKYHVSIVAAAPIAAGSVIRKEMLTTKNPGTGLESYRMPEVVGKRARVHIPVDTLISLEMLEEE